MANPAPSVQLRRGARGAEVVRFQQRLEELGYDLPRFGADGILGQETLDAVEDFQRDHCPSDEAIRDEVPPPLVAAIFDRNAAPSCAPPPVEPSTPIVRLLKPGEQGPRARGKRSWGEIRGITLHQTACLFADEPSRLRRVSAHWGILRSGTAVLIHDLDTLVWHGHGFNQHDVGMEINGYFEGVQGQPTTLWRPKSDPNRKGLRLTDEQAQGALDAIAWTIAEVAEHGGKIEFLHAHRQSHKSRTSDPGSEIWQKVGLVAKSRWGLEDGGPSFAAGGYPIPKEWDPSYTRAYRDRK